ncbi:MAG: 23S rRNA (uracil(1939)-C(5))-methyltransferase RlmD [Clostridia bacterium]|nr:23S rRNA (uracil(1939)-C(5))-methyltransferase RlmD [Clostridia bacterium]
MLHKNEEYEGLVEGYGTDGEGIIKIQGTTAFVPFCLVGERVSFKVLKVKGNIAYGKLIKVLTPSYARVNPVCPVFGKCGGCDLQHMDYAEQLKFKSEGVKNVLNKIGSIYVGINETVACEKQYAYRNKLSLPVGVDEEGNTVVGFYARRSHRIIPVDNCAIQSEWVKDVISAVKEFAKTCKKGVIRHIVARQLGEQFIFALVATKKINADKLADILSEKFKNFTLLLNVNDTDTNVIFGQEWHICHGEGFFEAEDLGIKYRAGANTFLQVNDDIREKLYNAVLENAEEGAVAIDLYSGGGMLTAMLAKKCGIAYGIEIVEEASRCADELKERNGLSGKMFNICGAVEDNIDKVFERTSGKRRIIVCDPPRKGMERSVVKAIARSDADKVILVSCNPATLARDLGLLCGTLEERDGALVKTGSQCGAYKIVSITPFDMFPQTKWVETLVVLSRKNFQKA